VPAADVSEGWARGFFGAWTQAWPMRGKFPPRAQRRPGHERVPEPGHAGPVAVPLHDWEENNRRRDTADGHASEEPPIE
jgi:hypothetical protein